MASMYITYSHNTDEDECKKNGFSTLACYAIIIPSEGEPREPEYADFVSSCDVCLKNKIEEFKVKGGSLPDKKTHGHKSVVKKYRLKSDDDSFVLSEFLDTVSKKIPSMRLLMYYTQLDVNKNDAQVNEWLESLIDKIMSKNDCTVVYLYPTLKERSGLYTNIKEKYSIVRDLRKDESGDYSYKVSKYLKIVGYSVYKYITTGSLNKKIVEPFLKKITFKCKKIT